MKVAQLSKNVYCDFDKYNLDKQISMISEGSNDTENIKIDLIFVFISQLCVYIMQC